MSRPQKPNLSFPAHFAATGQKTNFTQEKIENGFDTLQPDVLAGDNLNKFIDDVYQSITYSNAGVADLYKGVVIYDENETYNKNSIIFNQEDDATIAIYISKVNNNQGNPLTDETKWQEVQLGGGGLEIGDIGMALYIDETKGKRRWLNGSVMSINANTQGFLNWLKKAVQSVPSIATTETNWQAEASLSVYGQCGKFVIDETAGTIRLPKVVNIQGLQDLTKAGAKVEAGLPALNLSSAGAHTHTRGSMEITGWSSFRANNNSGYWGMLTGAECGGAFSAIEGCASNFQAFTGSGSFNGSRKADHLNFNASNSWTGETSSNGSHTHSANSIYGKSTTVQPEAVQYPYFIQIATGSETEVDVVNEIEFNNPFFFGMSQYYESEPNNLSWLKSNGQWNSGAVYTDFYTWLLNIQSGTEEVEGVSVKLSTETYTDYDFVLNEDSETFRLPLLNGNETKPGGEVTSLTIPAAGNSLYTANYNCFITARWEGTSHCRLSDTTKIRETWTTGVNGFQGKTIFIPRGHQYLLYYLDGTMTKFECQKATGNGSLYYYVGETVQNAKLLDAGRIAEQLPEKLDKSQKPEITGWGFPSTKYANLTLGATNTSYTMPADGWLVLDVTSSAQAAATGAWIYLMGRIKSGVTNNQNGWEMCAFIPVSKGEQVFISYQSINPPHIFRFVYAKGEA